MGFDAARVGRRLTAGQSLPTLLLLATLTLFAWLLPRPGYYAVKLLIAATSLTLAAWVWRRARRTSALIARFVAALGHGDLTQSFRMRDQGSGLEELGQALDAALDRLRAERHAAAADNRFARALLDEAPTAILTVAADSRVRLANKAARHLFREADGRESAAFARYGGDFAALIATIPPGGRELRDILWNGLPQRALVTASSIDQQGVAARVIAVGIIHAELQRAELATQADLVRVLTHEIMNSLTPVTSLATSAAQLLATLDPGDAAALQDARDAVGTLARRAAGITGFVDSYRDFARVPQVTRTRFDARRWADDLARAFRALPAADGVALSVSVTPDTLQIDGDPALLTQVLINLLKNAAEAAVGHAPSPQVALRIMRDEADRVSITVADNGSGVSDALLHDIFLPFFTTKAHGTGVGLSFGRLVVLLHGGTIEALPAAQAHEGGEFRILL